MTNSLLSLIIFAPLLGAAINWFAGRRLRRERFIGIVACASVGVSTIIAFYLAFKSDGALRTMQPVMDHLWTWIQVGAFRADFGLAMDRLSGIYALFVTFVGLLIHIFATGYMRGDDGYYRFFAYLNLFMFAMLTLVLANNFLLMFVGWEGVGLCSYLLIDFWVERPAAVSAGKKAFIVNRIRDFGFLLGMLFLFAWGGSLQFQRLFAAAPDLFATGSGVLTAVSLLLFLGATGKSAQLPLYTWLPDAMEGPTPVSALIHAATMVTAGVYVVARSHVLFSHSSTAMLVVAMVGCATAFFAATIGLVQTDIKKVLAYSTVSQLGYMFLACGVGAFVAGMFHVLTHAFFKACLFLGSGSVIHALGGEQDLRRMGGLARKIPVTYATFLVATLAISGVPLLAGFFSKDAILAAVFEAHSPRAPWLPKLLWMAALFTAGLTAFYMFRLVSLAFYGTFRGTPEQHAHVHESPKSMTVPLVVLALLSIVGGW